MLLVLLIIFLVVMPIMMKMETLEVPRKINDENEMPDPNATMLTVKVKTDGRHRVQRQRQGDADPARRTCCADAAPQARGDAARGTEKVVFVDFERRGAVGDVVTTMDTIRSLAADVNHDEIKVALKVKEDKTQQRQPPTPRWVEQAQARAGARRSAASRRGRVPSRATADSVLRRVRRVTRGDQRVAFRSPEPSMIQAWNS